MKIKSIFLTLCANVFLLNYSFSQDHFGMLNNENYLGQMPEIPEKVFEANFNHRELITPIEIKLERSLEQVLSTGDGGFLILNENDLFVKGQMDASRYYKGYKGAGTGTLIASLISPLIGLIPAIATSSTTPQEINLGYPDPELFKQKEYYDSYTQKSKKIKQGKVWTNWAIGFGVNLVAVLILLN